MNQDANTVRLLIVDEDPTTVTVSQAVFRLHGYETVACMCPEEALEAYTRQLPDAVLLEWSFRSGSGVGLTTRLHERALQRGRSVVIVVFSALEEPEGFRATEVFADYFVKPASLTDVAQRIRSLVRDVHRAHGTRGTPTTLP